MRTASWLQGKRIWIQRLFNTGLERWTAAKDRPGLRLKLIIAGVILSTGMIGYFWNLCPVAIQSNEQQPVEIALGTSLREVSQLLESRGLIRNRWIYEMYVRFQPNRRMAKAGRYLLGPGMTVPGIVRRMQQGTSPEIQVTIPEGLTNRETADLLARKGLVDPDRFLSKLEDREFMADLLKDIPLSHFKEGFLYPDTYRFKLNTTESQIIATMIRRFSQIYQLYLQDIPKEEFQNLLILASIVEKEAQKAVDRPIIAGVFYNRLRRGYPLQSCATIQYALGVRKERLLYEDLQIDSPYNTYKHYGLPPAPIANPGLDSLRAAAIPAQVNYLYFVAKPDGSHVFSNTYEQHLRAQRDIARSVQKEG